MGSLKILRIIGFLLIPALLIIISCDGGGKGVGVGYYNNRYGYGVGSGPILSSQGGQIDGGGFNTFGRPGYGYSNYFDSGVCIPRGQVIPGAGRYSAGGNIGGIGGFGAGGFGGGIGTLNQGFGRGLGTGTIRPPYIAANGHSIYKQSDLQEAIISREHYDGADYLQKAINNFYANRFPAAYEQVLLAEKANPSDSRFLGYIDTFKTETASFYQDNQAAIVKYEKEHHQGSFHETPDEQLIFDDINEFGESVGNGISWLIFNGVHNLSHGLATRARAFESQQELHRVDPYIQSLREAEEYSRLNAFGYSSWDDYYASPYGRITPPNC